MVSVLCVEHAATCGPDRLAGRLAAENVRLEVIRPYVGDPLPHELGRRDGLIVLGGPMGADDDETCPWLPATRALLAACVHEDRPVLAICLGHQLLCRATGGTVGHGVVRQRGPLPIGRSAAGRADPAFGRLPRGAACTHRTDRHDDRTWTSFTRRWARLVRAAPRKSADGPRA